MTDTSPKLSLVGQFDDLCRYSAVLTAGCEDEFRMFVENQLNIVQKWREVEQEVKNLQKKISNLESQKSHLNVQLKHIRSLFEQEMMKRKTAEQERNSLERQIVLIKEVLLADGQIDNQIKEKLVRLSLCKTNAKSAGTEIEDSVNSYLSPSDVDASSDDNIDPPASKTCKRRSKGKRRSLNVLSSKEKSQENEFLNDVFSEEVITNHSKSIIAFHSVSEPAANPSDQLTPFHTTHRSDSEQYKSFTFDFRRSITMNNSGSITNGRYSTRGKLSRIHAFCTKTVIRPEKCYACGHMIKFCQQALKCQDCRVTCHLECKDQCPVPCIPASCTPIRGCMGTVADYTTSVPPMIPSLIVHCINEIETRGLKEIGLYRIPGSEREVRELKEKILRGKTIPCLNQIDIHNLCGTVKEFLRSLDEPLVPRANWQDFVAAAENANPELSLNILKEYVHDLPQPNRDTLAFLVLHLQRIAQTPNCKMPVDNLAKVFGPTVLGYSVSQPTDINILKETSHQYNVMQLMLSIKADFWQNLLNIENDDGSTLIPSPEFIPAPKLPRLSPCYSSLRHEIKNLYQGVTPSIPRSGTLKPRKKQFRLSPFIK